MNKLRRVYEKPRADQPAEKKKPSQPPAGKEKKDKNEPKEKSPGQEDFARAVNALWGHAFLELTSSFKKAQRADEGETWE
jgi:hypothetical protein